MSDAGTIHERMAAILGDLPAIGKVQRNTQQNFMFRGHDDVLNALNPLLAKYNVFVVPEVRDRVPAQRQTSGGKIMFEVNLLVAYKFYGPQGDYVEASAWGEGTDMGDKATNKAMTMAFKNVLNQAFAISTAETIDSDADTPDESVRGDAPNPAQQEAVAPSTAPTTNPAGAAATTNLASDKQRAMIRRLTKTLNLDAGDVDSLDKRAASARIEELLKLEQMEKDAAASDVPVPVGANSDDDVPF